MNKQLEQLQPEVRGPVSALIDLQVNSNIDKVLNRIDAMEVKFDAKFDAMEVKFDAKFDALDSKVDSNYNAIKWLIISSISMLSIIATLLGVFIKFS